MATEKKIKTRIQLKYDTLANWGTNSSVVLKKGELGLVEIPSGDNSATTAPTILFKVGDGKTTFAKLKWASALAADVYAWAKKAQIDINETGTGNFVSAISWDATNNRINVARGNVVTNVETGVGLKVTGTADTSPTIEIDEEVIFVLDGGSSTDVI